MTDDDEYIVHSSVSILHGVPTLHSVVSTTVEHATLYLSIGIKYAYIYTHKNHYIRLAQRMSFTSF